MKRKVVFIQLIQIICALGVMNGHFMMHSCNDICDYLRNSNLKYSLLAFFFMGDLNVEVFFVLGGFLIRYAEMNDTLHMVLKKYVTTLIPGVCLTLIIGLFVYRDFANSINDVSILLTGNSYLDIEQYIPHYLYQLWFCFPFIKSWSVAYLVSTICKDRNVVFILICVIIVGSIDNSMISVLVGMLFGQLTTTLERNKISCLGRGVLIIGCVSIVCVPPLYVCKGVFANIIIYMLLGIAFSGMTLGNKYFKENKIINLCNKYAVSVYYVHVIIVKYISTMLVDMGIPIVVNYFLSSVMIIILAVIFQKYVIKNIAICFEKVFCILERICFANCKRLVKNE